MISTLLFQKRIYFIIILCYFQCGVINKENSYLLRMSLSSMLFPFVLPADHLSGDFETSLAHTVKVAIMSQFFK